MVPQIAIGVFRQPAMIRRVRHPARRLYHLTWLISVAGGLRRRFDR
ncbi:unnamed protein product [Rhodiola kirilowii]